MRIAAATNYAQEPLPTVQTIRGFFNDLTVTQRFDKTTPVGTYTYTVRVLQLGVEIDKKEVKIVLQNPVAKIEFVAGQTVETNASTPATRVVWNSGVQIAHGAIADVNILVPTPALNQYFLNTTPSPAVLNQWTGSPLALAPVAGTVILEADGLTSATAGVVTPAAVDNTLVDTTRKIVYRAVNSISPLTATADVYTIDRPLASA